ncbi:hypothetical protein AB2B38_001630 [Balneola sp. MJW-20]|uniref:hypothetical protein n=1 Tax=Gracilimonas aurantiaca TaxID=3234185 RepID=UPI00390A4535
MIEIIAYHGWGFDKSIWTAWENSLGHPDISFYTANRGYFTEPESAIFKQDNSYKILVAHSFGLHWAPEDQIKMADALILLNSFTRLPDEVSLGSLRSKHLEKMIRAMEIKLKTNRTSLLVDFWSQCYNHPEKHFEWNINNEKLLLDDLRHLRKGVFSATYTNTDQRVISIEAGMDKIVLSSRLNRLNEHFRISNSHLVETAGHALPFTHTDICISLIKEGIPIFEDYESGNDYSGY